MTRRRYALPFLLLAACGEVASKPAARASGGSGTSAIAPRAELAEMELGDGTASFKIHADGGIESPKGARVGSVKPTGELLDAEGGSVATFGADGKVDFGPDAAGIAATIADDGTLTVTTQRETFTARIGDDGVVTGTNPSAGKLRVKGADTPAKKRTVMLVLLSITMRKAPAPSPSAAPSATPPASP